ncbi:MAG: hypothetical protein MZU97_21830 [Bacillus subtilis]|nr:hypothetical protein [Bacillus subtilis]
MIVIGDVDGVFRHSDDFVRDRDRKLEAIGFDRTLLGPAGRRNRWSSRISPLLLEAGVGVRPSDFDRFVRLGLKPNPTDVARTIRQAHSKQSFFRRL